MMFLCSEQPDCLEGFLKKNLPERNLKVDEDLKGNESSEATGDRSPSVGNSPPKGSE